MARGFQEIDVIHSGLKTEYILIWSYYRESISGGSIRRQVIFTLDIGNALLQYLKVLSCTVKETFSSFEINILKNGWRSDIFKKIRSLHMLLRQNILMLWLYWFRSEIILMSWTVSTQHVISYIGSVWDGSLCNRWIASNDLPKEKKKYLLTRIENQNKDLTRPKTKRKKAIESACLTMH